MGTILFLFSILSGKYKNCERVEVLCIFYKKKKNNGRHLQVTLSTRNTICSATTTKIKMSTKFFTSDLSKKSSKHSVGVMKLPRALWISTPWSDSANCGSSLLAFHSRSFFRSFFWFLGCLSLSLSSSLDFPVFVTLTSHSDTNCEAVRWFKFLVSSLSESSSVSAPSFGGKITTSSMTLPLISSLSSSDSSFSLSSLSLAPAEPHQWSDWK